MVSEVFEYAKPIYVLTCSRSAVRSSSLGSCSWDLFSFPIHTPAEPSLPRSLVALCAFKLTVVFALGDVHSFAGSFPFKSAFTHSLAFGFCSMLGDFVFETNKQKKKSAG